MPNLVILDGKRLKPKKSHKYETTPKTEDSENTQVEPVKKRKVDEQKPEKEEVEQPKEKKTKVAPKSANQFDTFFQLKKDGKIPGI